MAVLGVIPARLGSTRLARKPLQLLRGMPLVLRVLERVRQLAVVDEVVVATDALEVGAVVERSGGRVVMTSPLHESGTERVAEVASRPEFAGFDLVLNIQGDEPFIPAEALRGAAERVRGGDDVGTASAPLDAALAADPARVKVVTDLAGRALYFSRAPIPWPRDAGVAPGYRQHLGVYAYTPAALARWVALPPTALERVERLEQLRPLAHGFRIGVAPVAAPAAPGIDTPDDLARADALWDAHAMGER
jgi:3-deoxy-manno-octulosonate cytidylyltransferase (CMP-KDO synthetase)